MKNALFILLIVCCTSGFSQTNLLVNADFSDNSGWSTSGDFYYNDIATCSSCLGYAYFTNSSALGGNNLFGKLSQYVTLPQNASSITFSFSYNITTQETGSTPRDTLYVDFFQGSSKVFTVFELTNVHKTSGYVSTATITLPKSLYGELVQLRFTGMTNSSNPTVFRIDNVKLLAAVPNGTNTGSVTWINGSVPPANVRSAAENLAQNGLINNVIDVTKLSNMKLATAAKYVLRALYRNSVPIALPTDYYPAIIGDMGKLSPEDQQAINALYFLESGDGRSCISRDYAMVQPNNVFRIGAAVKMLCEAWNIEPDMDGFDIYSHNPSTFLSTSVRKDDYNYGYFQELNRFGLLDDYVKNGKLAYDNVGEVFLVLMNELFEFKGKPSIPSAGDFYKPNNISLDNASTETDISRAVFNTYEGGGFSIPSAGFGLHFGYSYHSDWIELPSLAYNQFSSTYGNYRDHRAKQRTFPLGMGWTHTYNIYAQAIFDDDDEDKYLLLRWGDGSTQIYDVQEKEFISAGVYDKLKILNTDKGHITKFEITSKSQVRTTFEEFTNEKGVPSLYTVRNIVDLNNHSLNFEYEDSDCTDAQGGCAGSSVKRLRLVTDSFSGRSLQFSYQAGTDLLSKVTDPLNHTVKFSVDKHSLNLNWVENAKSFRTKYSYGGWDGEKHLLLEIQRPRGNIINNTYEDRKLKKTQTTDYVVDVDFSASYTKSSKSTSTSVTYTPSSGDSYTRKYTHNSKGTKLTVTSASSSITYTYGDDDNPTLPTGIKNNHTNISERYEYDNQGNIEEYSITGGAIKAIDKYTYNNKNQVLTHTWPNGYKITYTYDSRGNLTNETGNHYLKEYGINSNGAVSHYKDRSGVTTQFGYNQYGNLNKISIDGVSGQYLAEYDGISRIKKVTDANGIEIEYSFDENDNLKQIVQDPSGLNVITKYEYDENDNAEEITPPKGLATSLEYNDNDELIEERQADLIRIWNYNKDGSVKNYTNKSGEQFSYSYFPKDDKNEGKLKSNGSQVFTYDKNTRLLTAVRSALNTDEIKFKYDDLLRINNIAFTGKDTKTEVVYTYDISGNITKIALPGDNRFTSYEYDELNRTKIIKDWLGKKIVTYSYTPNSLLEAEEYGNGVTVKYHYDSANRLDSIYSKDKDGKLLHAIGATLDNNGNHIRESYYVDYKVTPGPSQGGSGPNQYNYTYADNSRLIKVNTSTVKSDENGNVENIPFSGFNDATYDKQDNLESVTINEKSRKFLYDPLENRYGNDSLRYTLDLLNNANVLLTKREGSNDIQQLYVHSPFGLVCSIDPNTAEPTYFLYDFRGSTVATVDKDQKVTSYYKYDPFGQIKETSDLTKTNPFLFVGKYGVMYESPNLYYMRARYYDAFSGRFVGEDPIWGTNLFHYANNNPISNIDPNGKLAFLLPVAYAAWEAGVLDALIAIYVNSSAHFSQDQKDAAWAGVVTSATLPGAMYSVPAVSLASRPAQFSDDLVHGAQQLYPKKANLTELHHITPKYLGGPAAGSVVPLNGSYHQLITNEFRALWPYGQGIPSAEELQRILQQVYSKFPLPPGY